MTGRRPVTPPPDERRSITARAAMEQLGIPMATIWQWVHRGDLHPVAMHPGRGHPREYPLARVLELAKRRALRGASRARDTVTRPM